MVQALRLHQAKHGGERGLSLQGDHRAGDAGSNVGEANELNTELGARYSTRWLRSGCPIRTAPGDSATGTGRSAICSGPCNNASRHGKWRIAPLTGFAPVSLHPPPDTRQIQYDVNATGSALQHTRYVIPARMRLHDEIVSLLALPRALVQAVGLGERLRHQRR